MELELEKGYRYIGKGNAATAMLHPAESKNGSVWYIEIRDRGGLHYSPHRSRIERIPSFFAEHGKATSDFRWEKQKCKATLIPPWNNPDKYELIYFIEAIGINRVKIGVTEVLHKRLRMIKTYSPVPLVLIGAIHGYKELEEEIHHKFKHLRKHGEWFEATDELREYIAHITKGQVVPELW